MNKMAAKNCIWPFIHTLHMTLLTLPLLIVNTQARIGYFWHITDLHLDTFYSTQGDVMHSCWRIDGQSPSSPIRSPGRFGDYFCDSPWSLIESAARAMKSRQGDNVEFVLWTGDGLSHSALKESDTKRLEILRNITDLLGRTFSSQFVFPVLGHEDGTTNFRHLGELWRHWLPSEALHTFEKGGYYSIEQTKSRLRIIALNTNFMRHDHKTAPSHLAAVRQRTPNGAASNGDSEYKTYYYHHGSIHQHHGHSQSDWMSHGGGYGGYGGGHHRGMNAIPALSVGDGEGRVSALSEYETQDAEKQWVWLEEMLFKSKNNKETVYIVGHIPPGSDERHIGLQQNGRTTFTETNNKRYLELVRKYSSIIQGQFFGHLHSDSFRIIYDDNGKPVSWMMISPSVTPRKLNVGSNNPAMRLYKFDTDSGQVLDYTQYFMDLQLANQVGEPNWLPEYNLTHYYALSDISAISLHNFVDRFTSGDGSWFGKYSRANTVRYQSDPCEGVCMLNHYCAITRVDYKEFRQCLEKEQSALRSHAPAAHTALAGACPMLVLMCALLASCCRQAAALLPKLITRMKREQQKRQKRRQPFVEKKERQIEFAALMLAMAMTITRTTTVGATNRTTTTTSKSMAIITAMLLNARTAAFALLLGILLMLQYALERSSNCCKHANATSTNTISVRAPTQGLMLGQVCAKMTTNKMEMENFCMQRRVLPPNGAIGGMLRLQGNAEVLLQQPVAAAAFNRHSLCYNSFNVIAVAGTVAVSTNSNSSNYVSTNNNNGNNNYTKTSTTDNNGMLLQLQKSQRQQQCECLYLSQYLRLRPCPGAAQGNAAAASAAATTTYTGRHKQFLKRHFRCLTSLPNACKNFTLQ
uniref:Acid sphingomyelinase-like phosphodiesterase 3b n=1 Tax=Ceratitis capitata TaxID=7213 RepID=W8BNI4_CERCA